MKHFRPACSPGLRQDFEVKNHQPHLKPCIQIRKLSIQTIWRGARTTNNTWALEQTVTECCPWAPLPLTNALLLTAKGLECIHPSVSFPRIRHDTTLRVRVSVWEADMKILATSPTADEYLRNMLYVYAGPCFAKSDTSHFRQMPQGPLRPFKFLLLALAQYTR